MPNSLSSTQLYVETKKLNDAESRLAHHLELFGDELAKREGYKTLIGIEAVHFYLCHKFHWQPAQVRAMNSRELRFLLSEDMQDWIDPTDEPI